MKNFSARQLKYVLLILFLIAFALVALGFHVAQNLLREYSTTISSLNAKADATDRNVRTLQNLEVKLQNESSSIRKARDIVAESKKYMYQDKIVSDIVQIAKSSGVSIKEFNFSSVTSSTSTPSATPSPSATAPSAATTPSTPAAPTSAGANSRQVSVTIDSPVKYENVMSFIKRLEKNSFKMQISNISMTRSTEKNGAVEPDAFTIKVFVR